MNLIQIQKQPFLHTFFQEGEHNFNIKCVFLHYSSKKELKEKDNYNNNSIFLHSSCKSIVFGENHINILYITFEIHWSQLGIWHLSHAKFLNCNQILGPVADLVFVDSLQTTFLLVSLCSPWLKLVLALVQNTFLSTYSMLNSFWVHKVNSEEGKFIASY